MVILGLDPGIATVGFGIISSENGRQRAITYGAITTPAGQPLSERLESIYNDCNQLIESFQPDAIAIEELFFNTNLKTGIAVAHGRGVLLLSGKQHNVPMYEYTPLQVKQSVVGYGRAEKKQVQFMVKNILGLSSIPKPDDAADALAVALTHMQTNSMMSDNSI